METSGGARKGGFAEELVRKVLFLWTTGAPRDAGDLPCETGDGAANTSVADPLGGCLGEFTEDAEVGVVNAGLCETDASPPCWVVGWVGRCSVILDRTVLISG